MSTVMIRRVARRWLVLAVVLTTVAVPSRLVAQDPATRPADDAPNIATVHDYIAADLAFQQRTLAGEYRRIGKRDPKWDTEVEAMLDGVARRMANAGQDVWYGIEHPSPQETVEACDRIVALGCDDPLVLATRAGASIYTADTAAELREVDAALADAFPKLRASDYHVYRKALMARWVCNMATVDGSALRDTPVLEQATEDIDDLEAACFDGDAFRPEEERVLVQRLWRPRDDASRDKLARTKPGSDMMAFFETVRGFRAHDWAMAVMEGDVHVRLAWDARGNGWRTASRPRVGKSSRTSWRRRRRATRRRWRCVPTGRRRRRG